MGKKVSSALFLFYLGSNLACVARPTLQTPRGDRVENDLNTPLAETPSPTLEVPKEKPLKADAIVSGEITSEAGTAERVGGDVRVAEESGSGVNNGLGPTGTLSCKGEDLSLTLRGTAVIGLTSGALKMKDKELFVYCRTNEIGVLWCQNLDSSLTIEIAKTEKVHKAIIRDLLGEPAQNRVIGTMNCVQ